MVSLSAGFGEIGGENIILAEGDGSEGEDGFQPGCSFWRKALKGHAKLL